MDVSIELAAAFERAVGERLLSAERLILSWPLLFPGLFVECNLAYRTSKGFLAAVARLSLGAEVSEVRSRFQFWCARAGGISTVLSTLNEVERSVFNARLARCDLQLRGVALPQLAEVLDRFITSAGALPDRPHWTDLRPTLVMDVGGQGWQEVIYDWEQQTLFIPGNIAPPVGDEIALAGRIPGVEKPVEVMAQVSEVRSADEAGPGEPAGFTLRMESPPFVLAAAFEQAQSIRPVVTVTKRHAPRYVGKASVKVSIPPRVESTPFVPAAAFEQAQSISPKVTVTKRYAPRYYVGKAPVKVSIPPPSELEEQPPVEKPAANAPMPLARIEYDNEQELAADYIANLSQGGAFVRTLKPAPVGSQVMLEMLLPGSVDLKAPATVIFTNETGMGVKFELDPEGSNTLSSVIARISVRPRRALVIDDDSLVCRMLADALQTRGFEVLTADDGSTGIQIVTEEILTLDLLVTDIKMPKMSGETLIRTIREAGGENELAIVVITGNLEPGLEPRLEKMGADLVLDKTLGPELIAQAADGVFEHKRCRRG